MPSENVFHSNPFGSTVLVAPIDSLSEVVEGELMCDVGSRPCQSKSSYYP